MFTLKNPILTNAVKLAVTLVLFSTAEYAVAIKTNPINPDIEITTPPKIDSFTTYQVTGSTSKNEQAAIAIKLAPGEKASETVSLSLDGTTTTTLNDSGIKPDIKADDGVYSAFAPLDLKAAEARSAARDTRLAKIASSGTPLFTYVFNSDHSVKSKTPYGKNTSTDSFRRIVPEPPTIFPDGITITPTAPPTVMSTVLPSTTNPYKTLAITDVSVVRDKNLTFNPCGNGSFGTTTPVGGLDGNVNGAWSFKTLMTNMAGPDPAVSSTAASQKLHVQKFVHAWLTTWITAQNTPATNGLTITPSANIKAFFPLWNGVTPATLNLDKFPFRLLAIMNRSDQTKPYGENINAGIFVDTSGETRFVFGLVDPLNCAAKPTTVILEYGNTLDSCSTSGVIDKWTALDALALPSSAYNAALKAITDSVTLLNKAPGKPNGSAINQIRTNEDTTNVANTTPNFGFTTPWKLREFSFAANTSGNGKFLAATTIKQTPEKISHPLLGSPAVRAFINANTAAIEARNYSVPLTTAGFFAPSTTKFLGASVIYKAKLGAGNTSLTTDNDFWDARPVNSDAAMHEFSIGSCNGCHARETATQFTHVSATQGTSGNITLANDAAAPALLSNFLTGGDSTGFSLLTVTDPRTNDTRDFNELLYRASDLDNMCVGGVINSNRPPKFSH